MGNKRKKLAVFDIDGTVFRQNLNFELIAELSWRGIFSKDARRVLVKEYAAWLEHKTTYENYREMLISVYAREIKNCRQQDVVAASQEVADFHKDRIYVYTKDLIDKLRSTYTLIAISGSPVEVVREFNKYLKMDEAYGTVYETDGWGKYTGRIIFQPVVNKGETVSQFVAENGLTLKGSIGVGDAESDISFLEMIDKPIAFNPNDNLEKIARRKKWKIIVEKKDVIYDISKFKVIRSNLRK